MSHSKNFHIQTQYNGREMSSGKPRVLVADGSMLTRPCIISIAVYSMGIPTVCSNTGDVWASQYTNSKTFTNKSKHVDVAYVHGEATSKLINNHQFKKMTEISNETFGSKWRP